MLFLKILCWYILQLLVKLFVGKFCGEHLFCTYKVPMGCLWVAYGMLVCGTLLRILYGLGIGSSLTDKYGFVVMPNSIIANHNI